MQRFSAWARWIGTVIFTSVLIPVAVHFIEQQPQETANVVLKFLFYLGEQAWLRITALILVGLMAGLWLDWFLRRLDDSRADEGKVFGGEMANFGETLVLIKDPRKHSGRIRSYFTSARKFGIWAPDDRVFELPPDDAKAVITEYLSTIGQMLKAGHFKEARLDAKERERLLLSVKPTPQEPC
jgi:hypothetical protein